MKSAGIDRFFVVNKPVPAPPDNCCCPVFVLPLHRFYQGFSVIKIRLHYMKPEFIPRGGIMHRFMIIKFIKIGFLPSKYYIRSTACHVCGNGNSARSPGLCYNLRFFFMGRRAAAKRDCGL